jgi:hypothetical protein
MHSLGIGTTRLMKSVITGLFIPSWLCREYTLGERLAIWRGKAFTKRWLRDSMFATDLTGQVTALDLPVYFLHGLYDYTVSYTLAKAYWGELEAPVKGFYTFDQSAHSPLFEEPEKVLRILLEDVRAGANSLADEELQRSDAAPNRSDYLEKEITMSTNSAPASTKTFACESCTLRQKAEANPKTLMARLWRWHTGWCPGWKAYQAHLAQQGRT